MLTMTINAESAQSLLDRLAAVGGNMPKTLKTVARTMEQQVRQAFRDQTDPWGAPWPQLKPATLKARASRRASGGNRRANQQMLVDSGAMFGSLRATSTADSASVEVGGGLPDVRAQVHQFGSDRVPARPFFPIRSGGPDPAPAWWTAVLRPIDEAIAKAIA